MKEYFLKPNGSFKEPDIIASVKLRTAVNGENCFEIYAAKYKGKWGVGVWVCNSFIFGDLDQSRLIPTHSYSILLLHNNCRYDTISEALSWLFTPDKHIWVVIRQHSQRQEIESEIERLISTLPKII